MILFAVAAIESSVWVLLYVRDTFLYLDHVQSLFTLRGDFCNHFVQIFEIDDDGCIKLNDVTN